MLKFNSTPAPEPTATATTSEYAEAVKTAKAEQWVGGLTNGQLSSLRAACKAHKGADGVELFPRARKEKDGTFTVILKAEPSKRGRKRGF